MKLLNSTIAATALLLIIGCNKHEVVPAPTPKVDLYAHFKGNINTGEVEYTQNVDDYDCHSTKAKTILPAGGQSYAIYYSTIRSEQVTPYMKLGLGNLYYDATSSENPPLTQFNSFFNMNLIPPYTLNAVDGFMVEYRDGLGRIWNSVDTTNSLKTVTFSQIKQESDETGDYSKFKCNFECTVYRMVIPGDLASTDSLKITNGVFEGYYRR